MANAPTEAELNKARKAKYRGFVNHLHASGKDKETIHKCYKRYKEMDSKREKRILDIKKVITG